MGWGGEGGGGGSGGRGRARRQDRGLAHPEGGEGADVLPGAAVGAAHLQVPLQPDLREDGGQVRLPVLDAGVVPCCMGDPPPHGGFGLPSQAASVLLHSDVTMCRCLRARKHFPPVTSAAKTPQSYRLRFRLYKAGMISGDKCNTLVRRADSKQQGCWPQR